MTDDTKKTFLPSKKLDRQSNKEPKVTSVTEPVAVAFITYDALCDERGEIIDWILRNANKDALQEIGLSLDRLVNKRISELFATATPLISNHKLLCEVMATGKERQFEMHLPWNDKHFLLSIFPLGSQTLVTTAMEITQLKRSEKRKEALNRINTLINSKLDLVEIIKNSLSEATKAIGTDMATITLIEDGQWVIHSGFGVPEEMIGMVFGAEEAKGSEIARRTKKRVIVNDTKVSCQTNPKIAKEFNFGSFIIHPIILKDEVIGALNFINASPGTFSDAQIDLVEQIAFSFSLAIGNARLFDSMQREIAGRKRAEDARHESGKLLGAVLQQMPAEVIIAEAPSGRIIMGNKKVEQVGGQPLFESAGIGEYDEYKGFHEDGRPYDSEEWPLARSITKGDTVINEEIGFLRRDGTRGTMIVNSSPIKDEAGRIVAGVVTFYGITERKQLEKALWETALKSEQRANELDAMISSIPDGLMIHDQNEKIVFLNEFARNAFAFPNNAIDLPLPERMSVTELTTVEGKPLQREETPTHRALNGEIIRNLELVINNGPENPMQVSVTCAPIRDMNGEITGAVTTFIDITARKKAEEALQKAKEELEQRVAERTAGLQAAHQSLMEQSRYLEAFFRYTITPLVFLDHDFNFIRVNEAYAKAGHKDVNEFPGHNHFEFYPSDAKAIFEDVVRTRQPFQVAARPFVYPDHPDWGVTYWDWTLTPLLDADGEVEVLVFALKDVTARKQIEIELEKHREHLEELVRERTRELETANAQLQAEIIERKRIEEENQSLAKFPSENPNPILRLSQDGVILYANEASGALLQMWNCAIGGIVPEQWRQVIGETYTSGLQRTDDIECNERIYSFVIVPITEAGYINMYGRDITERKRAEEALQVKQEELTSANEELQVQQEELTVANEELQAQTEELNTAYHELQCQADQIQEHAEATARARDEAERRAAELDATISSIAAGVIIYDNSGIIIRMNEFAHNMLGYSSDDYNLHYQDRSKRLDLCKSDGTPYEVEETPLYRALRGEIIRDEEMLIAKASDKPVWLSATLAPIIDSNQTIIGVIFIFTDITDRKREAKQKITNILESITDSFCTLDHEWRFTYLNKGTEKFSGKKCADLLGKIIWEEYPRAVKEPIYHYFHKAIAEQISITFEASSVMFDGWYEYRVYPGKDGLSVYFRDIAERKQSEKTAQQLAAIVENSEDAIISMTFEGKVSRWNKGAMKLYGYTAEEIIGQSALMIVPPEYHEQVKLELEKINQDKIFEDHNAVRLCKDGTRIYISIKSSLIKDVDGNVSEVSSIHRDITERVKLEEALTKERELLMVTLNSLIEGVVATDQDGLIILINEAAAILTGYSQTEAIAESINKIFYILDDKTSEPIIPTASRKFNNPILVTRDLREVPIAMNSSPIKVIDGRIIGTVTVLQDISEKQKTERELLKAEKLESLGILAGGIAHDFNNILAAILANIQLAMRKLEKNEDIKTYLLNTVETTRRASDLTKQLLTFSKGGAPVKKDASLIELIKDTAEFVLRGAKTKAEFKVPVDLWAASIDEGQISQVIHNLVLNAKQAMPKGGMIHISAENITMGEDTRFNPGSYVKITVKDQGVGIAKENLVKIFDPFFTTKRDGNGLGLATSYSIISQHNGYIEVESQKGAGTTFFIYLPALHTLAAQTETENEIAAAGVGLKILFMDDEVEILDAVGEMLKDSFDYQVVLATDGATMIELYKQAKDAGEPFDAVIMDLTVPGGMGGQEAIAYLRDFDPKIKAIISSGYANDAIMADYERYGFCGVVSKPYKIDELNRILYKVIHPVEW